MMKLGSGTVALALLAGLLAPAGAFANTPLVDTAKSTSEELSASTLASLRGAFGAYEEVRSDLASDQLKLVPVSASALAGALRQVLELSDQRVQSVVLEAALTAESLAQTKDLTAARITFGEVSRLLMVLADVDVRLVEGWHVFACPMVESYAKWMQPTPEIDNPYMGPAMPKCGVASDWSIPAKVTVHEAVASAPQPQFEPGIQGLRMVDVRDHKFLWREIDELQIWERGDRITVAEYRSKAIEKTAHFLRLEGEAAGTFIRTAEKEIDAVRLSFSQRKATPETSGVEGQFSTDLGAATGRLAALLEGAPRHQLFAPHCKKWLLKLAFGPREAKEARERRDARTTR